MGCLESKEKSSTSEGIVREEVPKKIDPRLPFDTYRQLFNLKNSWKTVGRNMTDTAKENLSRFFRQHPEHKMLHSDLAKMTDESKMYESQAFENAALAIFNVLDIVMEKADGKVDEAISQLERAGRMHSKIKGFKAEYFKDMEESFIESVRICLGDRFTEPTERNFRMLYQFSVEYITKGYTAAVQKLAAAHNAAGESNRI